MTNPSATGVEGVVQWGAMPVSGVRVELRENSSIQFGVGELYASATTGSDGAFRLTGARTTNVKFEVGVTAGYATPVGYSNFGACGDRVVKVQSNIDPGIVYLQKLITGLNPPSGSTVAAGPLTISWDPLAQTERYCLSLYDQTAGTRLTTATCNGIPGFVDVGTTARWTTPPLASGHSYVFQISALGPGSRNGVGGLSANYTAR